MKIGRPVGDGWHSCAAQPKDRPSRWFDPRSTELEMRDGRPVLFRLPEINFVERQAHGQSTRISAGVRSQPSTADGVHVFTRNQISSER